jgi:deoxyadenosine/deoxycytidine kinase
MNQPPFPYNYICIEGNIGAGKTSFCQKLQQEYDCKLILEEFDDNPFLPYFYKEPDRFGFTVELFFMTERHKQLQKHLITQDLFFQFTIADYFFTKTLLFARNNLSEEEYRLFTKLFGVLNQSFPAPDLLVYFHRSTDILMKNIKKRGRAYEIDITEQYLLKVQNAYFEYFRNIVSFPILIIDLNTLDFVDNPRHYDEIKYLITRKYNPGVHRMSLSIG